MHHHLLGIEGLSKGQINTFLDLADEYVEASKRNKITTKFEKISFNQSYSDHKNYEL